MTGLEVLEKIANAKMQYQKKNGKEAEYLIISQNLYFRLYDYVINNFSLTFKEEDFDKESIVYGMKVKFVFDSDFLMVGRNEILKLKGEKEVED